MNSGSSLVPSVLDTGDGALNLGDPSVLLGPSDGVLTTHGHGGMHSAHTFSLRQHVASARGAAPHSGGAVVGDDVDAGLATVPGPMGMPDYEGSHLDKKYLCDQCGFRTHRQYCLTTHMRTHTGEKPYKCPDCDKSYSESRTLKVHVATAHTGERPHKCMHCDSAFADPKILKRHLRTHSDDKPYVCGFCGRGFRQSYQRVVHMRRHTGERPYKCEQCDETFAQSSSFTVHMRKHTGERPYVCDVCQATFIDNSRLTSHKSRHLVDKPFKCDLCEEAFVRRPALDAHLRKHTGEKPFKCDHCDKAFSERKTLASHIRTHTGGKPTSKAPLELAEGDGVEAGPCHCEVCGQTFSYLENLMRHRVDVHNLEYTATGQLDDGVVVVPVSDDLCAVADMQGSAKRARVESVLPKETEV